MAAFFYDPPAAAMAISSDKRQFFVTLGERITQLRKARSITQVQMGPGAGRVAANGACL
jgi:hypothetical protein